MDSAALSILLSFFVQTSTKTVHCHKISLHKKNTNYFVLYGSSLTKKIYFLLIVNTVITLKEAQLLLKEDDDLILLV
jgi:hypothetical protein